jgi:antitoxin component HigA of HigAB toxin-antitoxin module
VSDILSGKRNPRVDVWLKLMRAAQSLEAQQYQADQKNKILLEIIRDMCDQRSTRKIAKVFGINPANLSHVLNGNRNLTTSMRAKLEPLLGIQIFPDRYSPIPTIN